MSKMNSTSLYVTTNQIVLKSKADNPESWQDLYRLVPYLRNSLCCVVCCNLLLNPLSPSIGKCQHHLCKKCEGGRKKIKPACVWCRECVHYVENKQLRTLLHCYKKMCMYLLRSGIYNGLIEQSKMSDECQRHPGAANSLLLLINEGANFHDDYQSNIGLSKAVYSILPCVYTTHNSFSQTQASNNTNSSGNVQTKTVNGTPLYSVMYAGTGNKITIKRKPKEASSVDKIMNKTAVSGTHVQGVQSDKAVFKKPPSKCILKQRRGCRCGNATATPGKLTCCGQRCPCYVESKACIECKCRGCRNPHTPDGGKILNVTVPDSTSPVIMPVQVPVISQYQDLQQIQNTNNSTHMGLEHLDLSESQLNREMSLLQHVKIELDANLTLEQLNEHLELKAFETLRSRYTSPSGQTKRTLEMGTQIPHMPNNLLFNMDTDSFQEDSELSLDFDV